MKTKSLASFLVFTALVGTSLADPAPGGPAPRETKVQIALLLDTSNSMDGLIEQTKTQLWKVVNSFIDAKRDGATPFVEVALYEYGNNALAVTDHYIRQVEPFTRDLDVVSGHLFSLRTNGGQEYCGAVVRRALDDLSWDDDEKTYKAIFIAGNEPFTQGPIDAMQACRDARAKGIIVNTIHCGPRQQGVSGSWQEGAANGGGEFMVIDQDRAVRHIPAPQDKRIAELGIEMNKTYLGYGKGWAANAMRQRAADEGAMDNAKAGAAVERAVAKASKNYHNASWDLVDAVREEKVNLAELDAADLPEELQGLSPEALKARIDESAKKRADLQKEIAELNGARAAFLDEARRKQAHSDGEKTFDEVMVETTRAQATKLGYQFKP
ncbi:MAG: VWA domain-containing protein [Luteolibacter sp.]|jgi:hypothetical protein